jgi:hypothetical protein
MLVTYFVNSSYVFSRLLSTLLILEVCFFEYYGDVGDLLGSSSGITLSRFLVVVLEIDFLLTFLVFAT